MKKILIGCGIGAGAVILLIVIGAGLLYLNAIKGVERVDARIDAEVQPVIEELKTGKTIADDAIPRLAANRQTRSALYRALHEIERDSLFPAEYQAPEKIAESDMVVWLIHPNELDAAPDEIVFVKEIDREEGAPPVKYRYFMFKYRTKPPHWAAEDGWIAGAAGPYEIDGKMLDCPTAIYSEFVKYEDATPEEHLEKIHPVE